MCQDFLGEFCGLVATKLNYSCVADCCVIIVYTNCTFSCLLVIADLVGRWQSRIEIKHFSIVFSTTLPHSKCYSTDLLLRAGLIFAM